MSKKIKSIRRFNQNYKNFSFSNLTNRADAEYLEATFLMDNAGNLLEEIKFDNGGTMEEKNSYEYNDKGKLLSHTLLYAIDDVTEKRVLTRNEKGLLVSEVKYYGDDSGERTTYEYDEKDNVVAIHRYDEEGAFISRDQMKYDDKGSLAEKSTFDAAGKLTSKTVFSPVEENRVEETEFDEKGAIVSVSKILFNDKGKEISSVQTSPSGKIISSVHNTYDDRGNLVEKVYKDFYSKKMTYAYNEKDLLETQELYDENGMLLRKNMFEYDDEGNITAEQTYEMDITRGGRDKHFGTRYEYEFY